MNFLNRTKILINQLNHCKAIASSCEFFNCLFYISQEESLVCGIRVHSKFMPFFSQQVTKWLKSFFSSFLDYTGCKLPGYQLLSKLIRGQMFTEQPWSQLLWNLQIVNLYWPTGNYPVDTVRN